MTGQIGITHNTLATDSATPLAVSAPTASTGSSVLQIEATASITSTSLTPGRFWMAKRHKQGRSQEGRRSTRYYGQYMKDGLSQTTTLPGMPVAVTFTSDGGKPMPTIEANAKKACKFIDKEIGAGPAFGVAHMGKAPDYAEFSIRGVSGAKSAASHTAPTHVHIVFLTWPVDVLDAIYAGAYHRDFFKVSQRQRILPGTSTSLEQIAVQAGFGRNVHARPVCEIAYRRYLASCGAPFWNRTGTFESYVLGPDFDVSTGMIFYRKHAVEELTGVPTPRSDRGKAINDWTQEERLRYFAANRAHGGNLDTATFAIPLGTVLTATSEVRTRPANEDFSAPQSRGRQCSGMDFDDYSTLFG